MESQIHGLSTSPALFTAINKDTAELHHELVPFDGALAQRMSDRAVKVITASESGELLPRITKDPEHYECNFCAWRERCWKACQQLDYNDAQNQTIPKTAQELSAERDELRAALLRRLEDVLFIVPRRVCGQSEVLYRECSR